MDVRTRTGFTWLQTVTSGRLLCIWQRTFRFCKMRAFLDYLGSYNLHVVSCNSAGLKLFQCSAIRCSHHLHHTSRTHQYSQFTSPLPTSTSFNLNIVTAVHNETLKPTPCMHPNPARILNSPPFPYTPCDWPVVQQRWRDSAILASQAGMAWAAIHHHTTSPQRGQTTQPNSFSGTPRLNQTKAWNNPMRINCAQEIFLHFWESKWRWWDTLFDQKNREMGHSGMKSDRRRVILNVHEFSTCRARSTVSLSNDSL